MGITNYRAIKQVFFGKKTMADISDPAIVEAYDDVRNDDTETDWCAIGYTDGDSLSLLGSGTGGVNGAREHFADDAVVYAYLRLTTGDEESKRAKFVLFTWVGPDVKVLRKAKVSVHKADVKRQASDEDGLDEEKLKDTVVKAGGANYMGQS